MSWKAALATTPARPAAATKKRAATPPWPTCAPRKLLKTQSHHFLAALQSGTVATNVFLRRFHNYAVGMHWLPWPVMPRLLWHQGAI